MYADGLDGWPARGRRREDGRWRTAGADQLQPGRRREWAAGATEVIQEARYAHLVGACRMGGDPRSSVADKFGRTHDIANLFICDGSVFPTQGSANPGLTIQALAARTADYLISQGDRIFNSDRRDMTSPPIRRDLAPPETWGKGVPRLK